MKPLIARFLLVLSFASIVFPAGAKPEKDPYFIKMKGFSIKSFNTKKIEIQTTAVFFNTYNAKAKLDEVFIEVYLEDIKIGNISQVEDISIPKQSAFDVPLSLKLEPPGPALKSTIWQSGRLLFGKSVKVKYVGYVKMKAIGFIPIKVKVEDEIPVSAADFW